MSTPTEPDAGLLAKLKAFIADHPEVIAELEAAAEEAVPPSLYEVVRAVIPMLRGIDDVRREELHAAVDRHEAEHNALVAAMPAPAPPASPSAPEPPADPTSPPAPGDYTGQE
jgi:hypothetical protein